MRIDPLAPNRPVAAIVAAVAAVVASACFCLLYTTLAGAPESVTAALTWGAINVAPFVLAFEAGKHWRRWRARAAIVAVVVLASLLLEWPAAARIGFEATRRIPAALLVIALLALADRLGPRRAARPAADLGPERIDWIEASANYVVAHGAGPAATYRATLAELEARFDGFVRVHRSILVRRAAIARVRPRDVLLHDGTSIPTGARYRANL